MGQQTQRAEINVIYCLLLRDKSSEILKQTKITTHHPSQFPSSPKQHEGFSQCLTLPLCCSSISLSPRSGCPHCLLHHAVPTPQKHAGRSSKTQPCSCGTGAAAMLSVTSLCIYRKSLDPQAEANGSCSGKCDPGAGAGGSPC